MSTELVSGGKFWKNKGTSNEFFRQNVVNTKLVNTENIIWAKLMAGGKNMRFLVLMRNSSTGLWMIPSNGMNIFLTEGVPPNGGHHTPGISTYSHRALAW